MVSKSMPSLRSSSRSSDDIITSSTIGSSSSSISPLPRRLANKEDFQKIKYECKNANEHVRFWGLLTTIKNVQISLLWQPYSNTTTCPLDPIPSHLLQAISPAVVPALTNIINTSLHTDIFPSAFKQARITLLLKKPTLNLTLLGNYRPVSLLPFIAKTLEWVVFYQVSAFLTQNNLLDSNRSGFRSGNSTETALLSVVEALRLARAASKSSLLILLDLSAAFDMVNHQILLSTLLRKGISGTALQ